MIKKLVNQRQMRWVRSTEWPKERKKGREKEEGKKSWTYNRRMIDF